MGIRGVWENWGVRGAWEAWDRVRRGAPGSVLRGEEGAVMRDMRGEEAGFCEMGHARGGFWGKGMTGEPLVPAQKEKASL